METLKKHINLAAYIPSQQTLIMKKVKNQCRWNQSQLDEYKREVDIETKYKTKAATEKQTKNKQISVIIISLLLLAIILFYFFFQNTN
jgi:hypothetical protein